MGDGARESQHEEVVMFVLFIYFLCTTSKIAEFTEVKFMGRNEPEGVEL